MLYRADGGHPIGTGHLFRAVRIIRELARLTPLEAHIVTADDPVVDRIVDIPGVAVHRLAPRSDSAAVKPVFAAAPVLALLREQAFDLVAVDMLDTPQDDMRELAQSGVPIVTFDDRGPGRMHADTLINILVEEPEPAALPASVRLLQGGEYVVLDPVFAEEHDRTPHGEFGPLCRIFIAMGGADAAGLTVKVARVLIAVPGLEHVEIVSGPAFPHRSWLESTLATAPWNYTVLSALPSLIDCYRRCDLAIVAGGLTMYEVCCLGTPSLAVCQPIDHQLELSDRLTASGAMATVGWGIDATEEQIASAVMDLANDPNHRRQMAEIGPTLVDGHGARRVAGALLEASSTSI